MKKLLRSFKIKTPHTYALLMFIIVIACLLTYLIPAGTYEREKKRWANCRSVRYV